MSRSAAAKPAFLALSCVGMIASFPALAAEVDAADGASSVGLKFECGAIHLN